MNCANHPERERIAFCQNCGKPLCQECARTVGQAVFCEPCLAAKLSGAASSTGATSAPPYTYETEAYAAVPPHPGAPSPVLATILGFLPGVGAMYNGQYAKGVVHLIVFAVLVTLANENGIFGLFIAGWIVYQAIEANHTARARLAGTPLPNPFGLNDLGERLGFGKAWPAAAPGVPTPFPGAPQEPNPPRPYAPQGFVSPLPSANAPPASNWGAPFVEYPYVNPVTVPPMPEPWDEDIRRQRFPVGAVWLIALGVLFLIGNVGIFHGFEIGRLIPLFLIGLGVWLFVHKMTNSGPSVADDGSPMYRLRLVRAARGPVWIVLVGVLFLLNDFNILSWGHSWPLFIIVGGLMTFFERTAYSDVHAYASVQNPRNDTQPSAASATHSSVSTAPADRPSDEERS